MKLFKKMKDGGPESTVTGYWLVEIKSLLSACLLKFEGKSREMFHTHAFNCFSWVIKGELTETMIDGSVKTYKPSIFPFVTRREDFHKVDSDKTTWVLTFRGPWKSKWMELDPNNEDISVLTHGRDKIMTYPDDGLARTTRAALAARRSQI